MPELPEVETVRRGLEPHLMGAEIVNLICNRENLRFPFPQDFAAILTGRCIERIERRAKFLLIRLEGDLTLLSHLGMTGRYLIEEQAPSAPLEPGGFYQPISRHIKHDHLIMELKRNSTHTTPARLIYNDVRRFGYMDLFKTSEEAQNSHLMNLGLEPLGNGFNGPVLEKLLQQKSAPLKAALLDQSIIAGLGNIYVCEAMHRARLAPTRATNSLSTTECDLLAHEIRDVLQEALRAGGSTLNDYRHADGTSGAFQQQFRVYDCEGAPCQTQHCTGQILRVKQAGRSTFYCASCQI